MGTSTDIDVAFAGEDLVLRLAILPEEFRGVTDDRELGFELSFPAASSTQSADSAEGLPGRRPWSMSSGVTISTTLLGGRPVQ